jgi:hypothetical protein
MSYSDQTTPIPPLVGAAVILALPCIYLLAWWLHQ